MELRPSEDLIETEVARKVHRVYDLHESVVRHTRFGDTNESYQHLRVSLQFPIIYDGSSDEKKPQNRK